jgi:hypothetical protein
MRAGAAASATCRALGQALARKLAAWRVGRAVAGAGRLIIGHEVARALGVRAIFAERRTSR